MNQNEHFTYDFRSMINILMLNSLGFFFLDFLIYYFTSQILNASGLQVGLIFSLNLFGNILSSTFTGIITDKVKSKTKLILIGSFGRGIAYFIFYFALFYNSLPGIYIGHFFLGFFVGFFWIPFNTLIAQKSHKNHRSQAFGRKEAAVGRGLLIGSIFGFIIFNLSISFTNNPIIVYSAIPVFGIANFFAGIKLIREVDESIKISEENSQNDMTEQVLKDNFARRMVFGLIFISIVLLLANINGSLSRPFLNFYLLEVITNDPWLASMAYLPAGIISMLIAPKLGKFVDSIKPELGISIASIFGAITTWFLINTNNYIIFSILLTLDITIVQTANLVVQNLLSRITLTHRGKIFSGFQLCMGIGSVIGPVMGGLAWDSLSITAPFIISIIVELCLIPFYIIAVLFIKPVLKEAYHEKKNE